MKKHSFRRISWYSFLTVLTAFIYVQGIIRLDMWEMGFAFLYTVYWITRYMDEKIIAEYRRLLNSCHDVLKEITNAMKDAQKEEKFHRKTRGFTLAEIVVTLAIFASIITVLVVTYQKCSVIECNNITKSAILK